MSLSRFELNVSTGESIEIPMIAYKSDEGEVLVIDADEGPPVGFVPFDPREEDDLTA